MKIKYDVVIIGAGPAGLSCAVELQKSGKSILLLEKNKEIGPKVCAGGLTTKVENLGLHLEDADMVFSSVVINIEGRERTLSNNTPIVATIDRGRLGKILLGKLSSQVDVITGYAAKQISDRYIEVDNQRIQYEYLVGADGTNSIVRKYLKQETRKVLAAVQYIIPEEHKELKLFTDVSKFGWGYGWIFPHKGYTAIGCGKDVRYLGQNSLKESLDSWARQNKIGIQNATFQGRTINFDYRGFDFGNIFLIGDAAGFASGMSGEGIYFSMVSGIEVARKIINGNYKTPELQQILKIKRTQELLLKFLPYLNQMLLRLFFRLCLFLLSFNYVKKKAFKLYS